MPAKTPNSGRTQSLAPVAMIALAALALLAAIILILRPAPAVAGGNPSQAAAKPAVGEPRSPERTPLTAEDGAVRLAAAEYDDGVARFYTYQAGGKTIAFFVLKGSDGKLRAAFDACDVCYAARRGYRQEGDAMVCNNCGNRFPSLKINVETGGCNPGPLKAQVQGDALIIQVSDIETGARYF